MKIRVVQLTFLLLKLCGVIVFISFVVLIYTNLKKAKLNDDPDESKYDYEEDEDNNEIELTEKFFLKKILHLDLKGAPPSISYLTSLIPLMKKLKIVGILMEYEDTFPYKDNLTFLRSEHFYYPEKELKDFLNLLDAEEIEVIPLVQTFGHLEFVLKHDRLEKLREVKKYPEVICPLHPETRPLLQQIIDQVIDFHPKIKSFHAGSDEVYHLGVCGECQKWKRTQQMDNGDLFLQHVSFVAEYLIDKHKVQPMVWDDHFRGISLSQLKQIDILKKIEPVVWEYTDNTERVISPKLLDIYSQVFPNMWAASAFKGAENPNTYFHSLQKRISNHESWQRVIQKSKASFQGIILTGWQRYDHLAVLCEILPMAIPSLVFNSLYLDTAKMDDSTISQAHDVLNCKSNILSASEMELGIEFFPPCTFPGFAAFSELLNLVKHQRSYVEFQKVPEYAGWLQMSQIKRGYSSPHRLDTVLRLAEGNRQPLQSLVKRLNESLENIFDPWTISEMVLTYVQPMIDHYAHIIKSAKECMKRFD